MLRVEITPYTYQPDYSSGELLLLQLPTTPVQIFQLTCTLLDFDTGNIVRKDVLEVLPYLSSIDTLDLEGRYLLEALEHSVAGFDPSNTAIADPKFLQFSGILSDMGNASKFHRRFTPSCPYTN